MVCRGYNITKEWMNKQYREKKLRCDNSIDVSKVMYYYYNEGYIYAEHDGEYLQGCIENLKMKGAELFDNP